MCDLFQVTNMEHLHFSSDDDIDIEENFLSSPDNDTCPFNLDEVPLGVELEDLIQQ